MEVARHDQLIFESIFGKESITDSFLALIMYSFFINLCYSGSH